MKTNIGPRSGPRSAPHAGPNFGLDLSKRLDADVALRRLAAAQRRLLHLRLFIAGVFGDSPGPGVCVVFEGWDASGKGGAIRRLVAPLDPRHVRIGQYGVPTEEERRHHFLWRFQANLPGTGELSIFDRSWYGRVLVERVEGFVDKETWTRSYKQIVDFERAQVEEGLILVKFWLQISDPEQLRRFESRAADPMRQWKLTEDDWRNRGLRPHYEEAVGEMLAETDHHHAHWDLVEAEHKPYARVKVVETVIDRIEAGLKRAGMQSPRSKGEDYGSSG